MRLRMRLVRRLFACSVAALLLLQVSGVCGAFELDPLAHCCCGDHDVRVPCSCPRCPTQPRKLRLKTRQAPAHHARFRSCGSDEAKWGGAVQVCAQLPPSPATPLARRAVAYRHEAPLFMLRDRAIGAIRPPP